MNVWVTWYEKCDGWHVRFDFDSRDVSACTVAYNNMRRAAEELDIGGRGRLYFNSWSYMRNTYAIRFFHMNKVSAQIITDHILKGADIVRVT